MNELAWQSVCAVISNLVERKMGSFVGGQEFCLMVVNTGWWRTCGQYG